MSQIGVCPRCGSTDVDSNEDYVNGGKLYRSFYCLECSGSDDNFTEIYLISFAGMRIRDGRARDGYKYIPPTDQGWPKKKVKT